MSLLITELSEALVTEAGDHILADLLGGANVLPLSDTTGYVQDRKVAQLETWAASSGAVGEGCELEVAFWVSLGYDAIPYGDARQAALEAARGSALTSTTAGDREYEFWTNA